MTRFFPLWRVKGRVGNERTKCQVTLSPDGEITTPAALLYHSDTGYKAERKAPVSEPNLWLAVNVDGRERSPVIFSLSFQKREKRKKRKATPFKRQ